MAQRLARWAHNPQVAGSIPASATRFLLAERAPHGSGSQGHPNKAPAKAGLSRRGVLTQAHRIVTKVTAYSLNWVGGAEHGTEARPLPTCTKVYRIMK